MADRTASDTLLFRYDSQGNILGFTKVTDSATEQYTYVKDLQGDILGILDSSGTEVAAYTYDAWGKVLTVTGTDLTLANRNPIRYRGYYYDTESGLYYLQSRYYDPELKRFISPDNYAQTYETSTGANMFAYCDNRPTIGKDDEGEFWHIVAGAIIGAAINVAVSYTLSTLAGTEYTKTNFISDIVTSAASGALAASGVGRLGQAFGNAAVNAISTAITTKNKDGKISYKKIAVSATIGFFSGFFGGDGLTKKSSSARQIEIINRNIHSIARKSSQKALKNSIYNIRNDITVSGMLYLKTTAFSNLCNNFGNLSGIL